MAIPIGMQYSEDPEESYRTLDLLLEQLLITIRQVLMYRRQEMSGNARFQIIRHRRAQRTSMPVIFEEPTSDQIIETRRVSSGMISNQNLSLSDLTVDSSSDCQNAQEQKQVLTSDISETTETTTEAQTHGWVQVGADLKRIADQLLAINRIDQKKEKKTKMKDEKDPSLLSLFCPPLGGPVWTTVALFVGWSLLSRTK